MSDEIESLVVRVDLDGNGFQNGVSNINRQLRVVKSEFQAASAALGGFGDSTDQLKLKADSLSKQMDLQRQKVATLKEAFDKSAEAKGKDAKATQELEIKLNKAKAELSKFENELRSVSTEIEKSGQEMGKSAAEAEKASGAFASVGERIRESFKGVSLIVGGAFAAIPAMIGGAMIHMTNEMDKAMGKVRASTNMTVEEQKKMTADVKEAYSQAYGDSFDQVTEAATSLRQTLGDLGNESKGALTSALTVQQAFGSEAKDSARSVKSMTTNFEGLSKIDAFDVISAGFKAGVDKSGDLIDTLEEYPVKFKQLGFGAQEMLTILKNGLDAGARNSDVVADSVKEFQIRATDGSKLTAQAFQSLGLSADTMRQRFLAGGETAKQAFYDTIGALDKLDAKTQQDTGLALFGTKWEDAGQKVILSLDNVKDGVMKTQGATKDAAEAMAANLSTTWTKIGRSFQMMFTGDNPLTQAMQDASNAVLQHMPQIQATVMAVVQAVREGFTWIRDNANTLIPVLSGLAGWIATAFAASKIAAGIAAMQKAGGAIMLMKNAWTALNATMLMNPWTLAIGALVAGAVLIYQNWDTIKGALTAAWNWIKETAVNIFNGIKDFFVKWGPTIAVVMSGPIAWIGALIYKNWDSIKQKTQEIWNGITSFFTGWWNGTVAVFSSVWSRISGPLTALWGAVSNTFSVAWEMIKSYVVGGWQNLVTVFTAAKDTIVTYVSGMWEAVKVIFATAFLVIYDVVTGKWGEIGTVFTAAGEKLRSIVGNVWSTIQGIWSGALAEVHARTVAVWSYISGLWESGMNYLQGSASGAWEGIKSMWNASVNSVVSFVVNLYNGVTGWFSNLWATAKQSVSDGWNAIIAFFANAPTRVLSYLQELKGNIVAKWEELKSDAIRAGGDFLDGFVQGIKDKVAFVRQKVEETFGDVVGWAKKVLDIHSPSRVMQEIGQWTMEGFVVGMEDKGARAHDVVQAIGEGVQKALSGINLDMDITNTEYQIAVSAKGVEEVDRLKLQLENLNIAVDASDERLANLNKAYNDTVYVLGDNAEESRKLYLEILKEQKALNDLHDQVSTTNLELQKMSLATEDVKSRMSVLDAQQQLATTRAGDQATMTEKLTLTLGNLSEKLDLQRELVKDLQTEYEAVAAAKGKDSEEARKLYVELMNAQTAEANLTGEIGKTNQALSDQADELRKTGQQVNEVVSKMNSELLQAQQEYQQKVADARKREADEEQKLTDSYKQELDNRTKSLRDFAGLFDAVSNKPVSGAALLHNLDTQVTAFEDWQKNMKALAGRSGMDSALVDELRDMGPKAGEQISALNRLTEDQLQQYVALWRKKNEQAKLEATTQLSGLQVETQQKIGELRVNVASELEQYAQEWSAKNATIRASAVAELQKMVEDAQKKGKDFISALATSINAAAPELAAAMGTITNVLEKAGLAPAPATGAHETGAKTAPQATATTSPIVTQAKSTRDQVVTIWREADGDLKKVLDVMDTTVANHLKKTQEQIKDAWAAIRTFLESFDLSGAGNSIMRTLLDGIESMRGSILSAVQSIANSALSTIQSALNAARAAAAEMTSLRSTTTSASVAAAAAGAQTAVVHVHLNGPVYGVDDLDRRIKSGVEQNALPILTRQLQQPSRARGVR